MSVHAYEAGACMGTEQEWCMAITGTSPETWPHAWGTIRRAMQWQPDPEILYDGRCQGNRTRIHDRLSQNRHI